MNHPSTAREKGMSLKESSGWFAAGESFHKALTVLSDGAFKLFAWLCLKADRRTGRYETTQKELAVLLSKSRRVVGSYIAELQEQGVCAVCSGKNQFARTTFQICDHYWPYHREGISWLNGAAEPIGNLRYFEPIIVELLAQPLPADYRDYLRAKNRQLAKRCSESAKSRKQPSEGGYSDMASPEIVQ